MRCTCLCSLRSFTFIVEHFELFCLSRSVLHPRCSSNSRCFPAMCLCVCLFVCMCKHAYLFVCMFVFLCVCVHLCVWMFVDCVFARTVCVHLCVCVCQWLCICVCWCLCACMYVWVCCSLYVKKVVNAFVFFFLCRGLLKQMWRVSETFFSLQRCSLNHPVTHYSRAVLITHTHTHSHSVVITLWCVSAVLHPFINGLLNNLCVKYSAITTSLQILFCHLFLLALRERSPKFW